MSWLSSITVGLIAGVFGFVVAGAVANASVGWYESVGAGGSSGYFLVLNAVFGGLIALVVGLLTSRAWATWGSPTVARASSAASLIVLAIGGATALWLWALADIPPDLQGQLLNLEVEIRLPTGETTPPHEIADPSFILASVTDRVQRKIRLGLLRVREARQEDGRWIIPATVFLFTSRGNRLIEAQLGGETIGSFVIPLPARPGPEYLQWSEWWPKSTAASKAAPAPSAPAAKDAGKSGKGAEKAPPPPPAPAPKSGSASKGAPPKAASIADTSPGYRFRIVRLDAGQRPPTTEDLLAQQSLTEKAMFEAIRRDAPISDWFPYTRFGAPDDWRAMAIANIMAKPGYVDELSALMMSEDNQIAAEALYLTEKLPQPPPALVESVAAAGRDLAARLDSFNGKKNLDQDAAFIAAADISIRFAAWLDAARSLRITSGADFVPELVAVLERSRVRTDNSTIQQDVRRQASRYAKEWGGVAPLPDDPPPR